MKTCPECAESVQQGALVCRYCRFRFDGETEGEQGSRLALPALTELRRLSAILTAAFFIGVVVAVSAIGAQVQDPVSELAAGEEAVLDFVPESEAELEQHLAALEDIVDRPVTAAERTVIFSETFMRLLLPVAFVGLLAEAVMRRRRHGKPSNHRFGIRLAYLVLGAAGLGGLLAAMTPDSGTGAVSLVAACVVVVIGLRFRRQWGPRPALA